MFTRISVSGLLGYGLITVPLSKKGLRAFAVSSRVVEVKRGTTLRPGGEEESLTRRLR